jgi:hypothetical protein
MDDAPLLINLERQLSTTRDRDEYCILQIRRAIYLARTNRISEALLVPSEVRRHYVGNENILVYTWLWLLEGICSFYQSGTTVGIRFLNQSLQMARVSGNRNLAQYAAAWLAQFHLTDDNFTELASALRLSGLWDAVLPEARCRAGLVYAGALANCCLHDEASKAYGRARDIARELGDRASIMASIENKALFRLDELWVNWALDALVLEDARLSEIEIKSGLAYEIATGSQAHFAQVTIVRARLDVLRGDYGLALDALEKSSDDYRRSEFSMVRSIGVLKWWLRCKQGASLQIKNDEFDSDMELIGGLDNDDALVCWKLAKEIAESWSLDELRIRSHEGFQLCRSRNSARIESLQKAIQVLRPSPEL